MDDEGRKSKRAHLMEQKNAIEEELQEMNAEELAMRLYDTITRIRQGTDSIHDLSVTFGPLPLVCIYDNDMDTKLHDVRPKMTARYLAKVMCRMLLNARNNHCTCDTCAGAYLGQIDQFAVVRDGRVVGLNRRYCGGLIVPIE